MSAQSPIEWTDATWNPVTGCDKVSAGCKFCYAEKLAERLQRMGNPRYTDGFAVRLQPDALPLPTTWRKPRRIFVNSMSDLFHKDVPDEYIDRTWAVMASTSWHTYQVLTKRADRLPEWFARVKDGGPAAVERDRRLIYDFRLKTFGQETADRHAAEEAPPTPEVRFIYDSAIDAGDVKTDNSFRPSYSLAGECHWRPWPLSNVWLGVSVEDARVLWRIDELRKVPAAVRFLSIEPLIGPLPSLDLTGIHWVIVGGESGPGARPMDPAWVRSVRDQCVEQGVPFFFKQWGGVNKKKAGRSLDGRTWDQLPETT